MSRRIAPRLVLASTALVALAACVVNLTFDMPLSGVAVMAPMAGTLPQASVPVDLGNSAEVRAHQKEIRSLDLDSIDVTITGINPPNAATVLSATFALRKNLTDPATSDVAIGNLDAFNIALNERRSMPGNPQLDAFLLERLHDGGKFYVIIGGSTNGKTDIVVDINLHASMGYETGLF
jgi:hypothetical protein